MTRKDAAAPGHVCPGIRIHAIDMVQPPGIGIPLVEDIEPHQTIVKAALATKSSAETAKKACCGDRREAVTAATPLIACRTRRGGATRDPFRCAPKAPD